MMKNILFCTFIVLCLSSCCSTFMTAHEIPISVNVSSNTIADLQVSQQKIEYTYIPTELTKRTGLNNIIKVAIHEALKKHGNADVLVEMNYTIECKSFLGSKKVSSITIFGFPAYYHNFRSISGLQDNKNSCYSELPQEPQTIKDCNEEKNIVFVDLGLSVKWANKNIGAGTSFDYGEYFAWGELSSKEDYSWKSYKYSKGKNNKPLLLKYCENSSLGEIDNKTKLESTDDIATNTLGDSCRIPSDDEWFELITKCEWTWNSSKGGYIVRSKAPGNENSIFLPIGGCKVDNAVRGSNDCGQYWSSTLMKNESQSAILLYINSKFHDFRRQPRYVGLPIRAICK